MSLMSWVSFLTPDRHFGESSGSYDLDEKQVIVIDISFAIPIDGVVRL